MDVFQQAKDGEEMAKGDAKREEVAKEGKEKMKANLEFNLPEDDFDYKIAVNAFKMYSSLYEISNIVRKYYKYIEDPKVDDLIEEIREELSESRWDEME